MAVETLEKTKKILNDLKSHSMPWCAKKYKMSYNAIYAVLRNNKVKAFSPDYDDAKMVEIIREMTSKKMGIWEICLQTNLNPQQVKYIRDKHKIKNRISFKRFREIPDDGQPYYAKKWAMAGDDIYRSMI